MNWLDLLIVTVLVTLPGTLASWWSPDPTLSSNTEDAECDWALHGEMSQVDDTGASLVASASNNPNGGVLVYYPNTGASGSRPTTGSGGYNTGSNGYNTGTGGYNTGNKGYSTGSDGYNTGNNGYDTDNTGYNTGNNGYDTGNTGYDSGNNGYNTGSNGYNSGSPGYSSGTGTSSSGSVTAGSGTGYASGNSYANQNPPYAAQRFFKRQLTYMNPNSFSGLHPTLPIGSSVIVTQPENQRSVTVQIVGRPEDLAFGRCLTLSRAAFAQLADLSDGVTHCQVTPT